ncbi:molybdenum cofactor guanylyltransferase [Castellaniella hirudinis]|uniref:molybdenum cofactor guanylyltransferase n=1 Tax=Castellaniella hirudinis TaxID=1144617 RepID=UPI0039C466D7
MAEPPRAIEALVLAGGQSRRMRRDGLPHADKGLMYRQGRPQVRHVCDYLVSQGVARIWISTNRHPQDYALYGDVLADAPDFLDCGPLAGVLAGLQHARSPWLFVLPVDVVRWPAHLLPRLAEAATPSRPAYARTPDGPHPLCLMLHRDMQPSLDAFLRAGQRQAQAWLRGCQARAVDFPDAGDLLNLNTPDDWLRLDGASS